METITIILLCLTGSYLLAEALKSVQLPRVLGPILVGLLMGLPGIREFIFSSPEQIEMIRTLGKLGLIFLMFYTGLQIDIGSMARQRKDALTTLLFSAGLPLVVGTVLLMTLFDLNFYIALLISSLLAISAEEVTIGILNEMGIQRSRIGQLILAVGAMDDILEITILSIVVALIAGTAEAGLSLTFLRILIFISLIYVSRYLIIPLALKFVGSNSTKSELFVASLIMVLFLSVASEFLVVAELPEVGMILGALFAGIVIKYTLIEAKDNRERVQITDLIETLTFGFFAPFFFIIVGLDTDLRSFILDPAIGLLLLGLVLVLQPLGAGIGAVMRHRTFKEGLVVGCGLTTKGGIELIAASLLKTSGLINDSVYSGIIFMALFATLLGPVLFKMTAKRWHFLDKHQHKVLEVPTGEQ